MLNILLTGVGGQGTVLAAKLLAQAAQTRGWNVRTAETIGMAQRGGSVVSHVRMGNDGEEVLTPLLARATADLIVAFEPAEGARVLPYLAGGRCDRCGAQCDPAGHGGFKRDPLPGRTCARCAPFALCRYARPLEGGRRCRLLARVGSRKALNTVLLASALGLGRLPLDLDDLREAVRVCVKPQFVELNLRAINIAAGE